MKSIADEVKLIAILDLETVDFAELERLAGAAADGGATSIQVRGKNVSAAILVDATERVIRSVEIPVYVNDRADVAWATGAVGVHLGSEDLPADLIRDSAPPGFRIGVSVGNSSEAETAKRRGADYWSVGSVFATPSKPDAGPPIETTGFARLREMAPDGLPVIGIGGITSENLTALLEAGADGVAVISAIFRASNVEAATRELRSIIEKHRRSR